MTEELEKEAEKHADGIYHYKINVSDYGEDGIINYRYSDVKEAYQKGAEPREREIESLGKRCLQLQKDKGNLIDKVNDLEEKLANADYQLEGRDLEIKELKSQIEKLKCCYNCKHSRTEYEHCKTDKHEKWEIKENGRN